jgi:SAM-dependent methyltransferase
MGERTPDQIREQYEIEKEIASRLRAAPRAERPHLYGTLYDELFARVPHHPQLHGKRSPDERAREVAWQVRMLAPFLTPATRFLEIGAGDCAVSLALAPRVRRVTAVDVSAAIVPRDDVPANFALLLSNGVELPIEPGTIDVAYSNQMIEHLHPDDAATHVAGVHAALAPHGVFVCITPNRLTGPHDVSLGFDAIATGLHLREYTAIELAVLLRAAGFRRLRALVGPPSRMRPTPLALVAAAERLVALLPPRTRTGLASNRIVRTVLGVRLAGWKAG